MKLIVTGEEFAAAIRDGEADPFWGKVRVIGEEYSVEGTVDLSGFETKELDFDKIYGVLEINGDLILVNAHLGRLSFGYFKINGNLVLTSSRVGWFEVSENIEITGDLDLSGCEFSGEATESEPYALELIKANIGGSLNLCGAKVTGSGGASLYDAKIIGDVLLDNRTDYDSCRESLLGALRGAKIKGCVHCNDNLTAAIMFATRTKEDSFPRGGISVSSVALMALKQLVGKFQLDTSTQTALMKSVN